MKNLKRYNDFVLILESEINSDIDWNELEDQWSSYIEQTNNEQDYEDEFKKLKSFFNGQDINWKEVRNDYYDYIEQTNNEDDYDVKFRKFKKMILKALNK